MVNWTKQQIEAIQSNESVIAISAGAGSGKTSVLVERVLRLIDEGAKLSDLLVITFTEKAAGELKERINKKLNDPIAVASSYIGTFHSFCAKILRENSPFIGIDPDFKILDEQSTGILKRKIIKDEFLKMVRNKDNNAVKVIEELDFKNAIQCIEELIDYRWHTTKLLKSGKTEINSRQQELKSAVLECFNKISDRYKQAKGLNLDFADLEIETINLLKTEKDLRAEYQKKFKNILVDEYQDINDTQAELISLLHEGNSLVIVGDRQQSIYRFRGANVHAFESGAKKGQLIQLFENHRSDSEILDFINLFFGSVGSFEKLVPTIKNSGGTVTFLTVDETKGSSEKRKLEAKAIADIIGHLKGQTAILFRSLKDSSIYTKELSAKKIPYSIHGGMGFLDLPEISDILHALIVASEIENGTEESKKDLVALVGLARSPLVELSDEELYLLCRPSPKGLFEKIKKAKPHSILPMLERETSKLSISELIRTIGAFANNGNISDNIEKLSQIAFDAENGEKLSLKDFIDNIYALKVRSARISEFPSSSANSVCLMTIHQAKGLEFDNVILADIIREEKNNSKPYTFLRGEIPRIGFKLKDRFNPMETTSDEDELALFEEISEVDKKENEAESNRLFYVAMTRAKNNLIIPVHKGSKKAGRWHKMIDEFISSPEGSGFTTPSGFKTEIKTEKTNIQTPIYFEIKNSSQTLPPCHSRIFTVTELEAYRKDKKEYQTRYEFGNPVEKGTLFKKKGLPPNIIGDIIHRMIECSAKSKTSDPTGLLSAAATEAEAVLSDDDKKDILAKFGAYTKSPYHTSESKNETPFILKIGSDYIKGKLDMLILGNNEWEIVDFKTGNSKDIESAAQKYDLQLKAYGLAAASATGIKNGSITLVFLTDNGYKTYGKKITPEHLKTIEAEIKETISGIKNRMFD